MAFLLIPVILLAVVWLSYIRRRLSELNENVNTAMNQIGLQLSSRFRALEALLELARTHGLSAQLVLLPVFLLPVEEVEELSQTQRGEGGFGSTGR